MARPSVRAGFTIIEMMISIAVVGIVTSQIMAVFTSQHRTFVAQERVVGIQEDARLAADMILMDVRMSGFMVPVVAGISSVDGGTSAADVLCSSDSSVISAASLAGATGRFDRAKLTSDLGASQSTVALAPADMDIDGDGNNDFAVNRGIIIAGGTKSYCARITAVTANSVSFTPGTPAGFSVTTTNGRAVPASIYEVSGSGLRRNALLISSQVEDIQVEFAVDSDGDGQIGVGEFPIHDLDGSDVSRIRGVQLSVLTRTLANDPQLAGPGRQAVANRTASGTADGYRRRLARVIAAPRNLL